MLTLFFHNTTHQDDTQATHSATLTIAIGISGSIAVMILLGICCWKCGFEENRAAPAPSPQTLRRSTAQVETTSDLIFNHPETDEATIPRLPQLINASL